jgi:uncharacterized protein YcbK (DUF882 family)
MIRWADIKYFKSVEFDSPDSPGSGAHMNLDFVAKLDAIREACKEPLTINSGYRTLEHNATISGVDSSSHSSGHAADIRTLSSTTRCKVLEAAFRLGFRRVGIGKTFVHLDDDLTKPQDVVWTYPDSAKRA